MKDAVNTILIATTLGILGVVWGTRPVTKLAGAICIVAAVAGSVALAVLK